MADVSQELEGDGTRPTELVIVGNSGGSNVGTSLKSAALTMGLDVHFCDAYESFSSNRWLNRLSWRARGHRPPYLSAFSKSVVRACQRHSPRWLLTTGLAPVDLAALSRVGKMGIRRLNYLTDDPWNPSHKAAWFFDALRRYDRVFSVRRSNLDDLRKHGCEGVEYLPFGFEPRLFYPGPKQAEKWDVLFAGGADRDRLPFIAALLKDGLRVALYGDYWDRFEQTRGANCGHATPEELGIATLSSKISLCLVRRANRDGHVMRSFEIPAIGGCMLTEDTEEHREMFGAEGETVLYFNSIPEMLDKARWLLDHDKERARLAAAAHGRIINGLNTYRDRLEAMLA